MTSSNQTGIVAALAAEARTLGRGVRMGGTDGTLLAVSGMGCDAAARSANRLADAGCGALVSWGLAGGLDPSLSPGTIVLPQALLFDAAPVMRATPAWRERLARSLSASPHAAVVGGSLLTSQHPLVSVEEKEAALRRTGAVAVDTESYAIAKVAAARGLLFLAVRVIVDTANDALPSALTAVANAQGRIDIGRLIGALLAEPQVVAPLLRLARRYSVARKSLRVVARRFAP